LLLNLSDASLVEVEQLRSGLVEETPRLSVVIVLGGSWETDNLQVGSLGHLHVVDSASRCKPQSNYGSLVLCWNLCIVCKVACEALKELVRDRATRTCDVVDVLLSALPSE
jgi:hypothetical protein